MKTLNFSRFSKFLLGACLIVASSFLASCGDDDDKVNCSKIEQQYVTAAIEALTAASNDDCDGIDESYAKMIEAAKKGKSCELVDELLDEYDADSITELEEALLAERDAYLDDSGCNND